MDIIVKGHEFFYDITSASMLFFPGEKTEYVNSSKKDRYIYSNLKFVGDKQISKTTVKYFGKKFTCQKTASVHKNSKDLVKYTFYSACKKATGIISPWGALTGIRPLSVYERLKKEGYNPTKELKKRYLLSDDKISILNTISNIQNMSVTDSVRNEISVYISIPFCPSKCSYCSFISISSLNKEKLLKEYLDLLIQEIDMKFSVIRDFGFSIASLYIGGGTPGILSSSQLRVLLDCLKANYNLDLIKEKCFEIGRPDTVNNEKLDILSQFGFDRLCINTQTTSDEILKYVNRTHSSDDYLNAVKKAKKYKFKIINTDLIAGLPTETVQSFKKSVDDVVATDIENITIHTLSIKKSAKLAESDDYYNPSDHRINKMLDYAYDILGKNGYYPYYIYRQKNCVSNGENIGFCKRDLPCLYNIYMMEDIHTIVACGAGASSKVIDGSTVQRIINVKYPLDYVNDFEKICVNTEKLRTLLKVIYDEKNSN